MLCPADSWQSSRFGLDSNGKVPLGHVYAGLKPLGAPAHRPHLQVFVDLVASARVLLDSVGALLCCISLGTQPQKSLVIKKGVR